MSKRALIGGFLFVVCLAMLWGIRGQRSQLANLGSEQQQLLTAKGDGVASSRPVETTGASFGTLPQTLVPTPELLRLRNEVTRLTERRRELASVRAENERLRAQVASRGTNYPNPIGLPTAYVRTGEARMVGYNTPDDTLQSMLWAVRNHDLTNLLHAYTPEMAGRLLSKFGQSRQSIEDFLRDAASMPGLGVVGRKQVTNNSTMEVEVTIIPGKPGNPIPFRQINGQWKIAAGF
jgi:hypothetical protein